jgi:hypothetical protein
MDSAISIFRIFTCPLVSLLWLFAAIFSQHLVGSNFHYPGAQGAQPLPTNEYSGSSSPRAAAINVCSTMPASCSLEPS